jgi:tetratricopeptide (TPR) repeat protein
LNAPDVQLDLAIVLSHTDGPQATLDYLAKLPETAHSGDYYFIKAQALQDLGKTDAAIGAVQQAVSNSAVRSDLYEQAALFLVSHGQTKSAVALSTAAVRAHPDDPAMLLLQAAMLASSEQATQAEQLLKQLENRWPEWAPAYVTYGAVLEAQHRDDEAKLQVATATALGVTSTDVYYFFPKSQFMRAR